LAVERITALWALSEAALGGILHALNLPFKGMLISGGAITFISLIGVISEKKGSILKATFIVLAIKYLISPYTPVTAAIAVLLQGLLGELFFSTRKFQLILIPLFAVIVELLTGLQKILIVTIIFGSNFWNIIDKFSKSLAMNFFSVDMPGVSIYIISIYLAIHILFGIFISMIILRLPKNFNEIKKYVSLESHIYEDPVVNIHHTKKSLGKPSIIMMVILFVLLFSAPFIFPGIRSFDSINIVLIILRAVLILLIWFFVISPLLQNLFKKLLSRKTNKYFKNIDDINSRLPAIKNIVITAWKESAIKSLIKRIKYFITLLIYFTLSLPENNIEHDVK